MDNAPSALPGEASFAASGTCLRLNGLITIVTGGGGSRILASPDNPKKAWVPIPLPLTNGKQSRGAFSIAFGKDQTIIVGGDYENDKKTDSVVYIILESATAYHTGLPVKGPNGFQSCISYLNYDTFLTTGTPGSNITMDGGKTWIKIDDTSFNVCSRAKHGKLVLLAGNSGKIGIFKP